MVLKTRLFLLVLLLLSILTFVLNGKVFAVDYLIDNFDSLENWDFVPLNINDFDSWSINLENQLVGSVGKTGSSFLFSKKSDFGSDFSVEFDAINISGVDQNFLFGIKDRSNYYVLDTRFPEPLWPQDNKINQIVLFKYYGGQYHELKRVNLFGDFNLNLQKNEDYKFSIFIRDKEIKVYINNILVLSFTDQDLFFGGIGFFNWGGDFNKAKTINNYDNLVVNSSLVPTSTPIPTPTPRNKIIILPGLGASWNSDVIAYDNTVNNNEWKMTPFVNNYDGLVETLEKNGLEKNKDFFIWNYDWRKPIGEIVNSLNSFIDENIDVGKKIDFIGHSLGGVVARIWSQEHKNDQRLGNLITLGSPNMGSLDTYEVWNGGKVSRISDIGSLAMQILLTLKNKGPIANLENIRSYVPIVKDLLPTENYVIKKNRVVNNIDLETNNDYLIDKNNSLLNDQLSLSSVVGIGFSTTSFVKLEERSVFDKVLRLWPDGKPIGYNYDSGDKTVLRTSANFGSTELVTLNSDHGKIVLNGIDFLMEKLDLEMKELSSVYQDNLVDSLVFYIGSPAKLKVICGGDIFEENDGFVIIKNKNYNDCNVNLKPVDNGIVHLVFGNTSNIDWNYLEKNVTLEKEENFSVYFNNGDIKFDKNNKDFLISSLNDDFKIIGLNNISKYINNKNWNYLINKVFVYRKKNNENLVSKRILDNLYILSSIENKCNKRNNIFGWVKVYRKFLDKMVNLKFKKNRNLSQFAALSFKNLEELNKKVKGDLDNKNCLNYQVINDLFVGYGLEVLRN
ncbi:MAG: hypothetical protein PHX34_05145 [Candidatus Shapirobacteria bacterium]|nr:hypothetical protein [Candidatus Shapirobacteria bacterium]